MTNKANTLTDADRLTLLRIAAVPVLLVLVFAEGSGWAWAAVALYILAALTDWLDGVVARRHGGSRFGRIMDPIADKLLVVTLLLALAAAGRLPGWAVPAALAILAREIVVSGLREAVAGEASGENTPSPSLPRFAGEGAERLTEPPPPQPSPASGEGGSRTPEPSPGSAGEGWVGAPDAKPALPVTRLAKWKTAAQMTALGLLLTTSETLVALGAALLWIAAALTLWTGAGYLKRAFP